MRYYKYLPWSMASAYSHITTADISRSLQHSNQWLVIWATIHGQNFHGEGFVVYYKSKRKLVVDSDSLLCFHAGP